MFFVVMPPSNQSNTFTTQANQNNHKPIKTTHLQSVVQLTYIKFLLITAHHLALMSHTCN